MKLNSKELRKIDPLAVSRARDELKRQSLYLILENIYDTYNIGGLFRLADGLGVAHMYLCGETTPPPNNRIHKASCGTYKVVPWTYCPTVDVAIQAIKHELSASFTSQSLSVVSVEQSSTSIPYYEYHAAYPIAVIVGNETTGVTPAALALCDHILEIPMWGINKSLNVIVSAGIVSYSIATQQIHPRD
ncbi:MAG: TrmH family RNA methyltransferase [Candidatus Roizmanbacteria bacterium]